MIRKLLERLGLVRRPTDAAKRYRGTDDVIVDARAAADTARRLRLRHEDESYRRRHPS